MARTFNIAEYLKHVFLFENLSSDTIAAIANKASVKRLKKKNILFNQGESADAFYIIVTGKVSVTRLSNQGYEQVLHIHGDGDIVAEGAIFDKIKYPASCHILSDSLVVKIPKLAFTNLLEKNPKVSLKILSAYSKRLREFVSMVEYLSLDSVEQRIIKYLNRHKVEHNGEHTVSMTISKKDLAYLLGTIPVTLSRNLKSLKEKGIIEEKNKVITILDSSVIEDL